MKKIHSRMDESILVCVSYGPNGERLIRRGHKLASMLDCPLYMLTVDALPSDEFDAEKSDYIEKWQQLAKELEIDEFIIRDNEKKSSAKAIAEVVNKYNITQVIVGQSPQNRWEEITKGSFINTLLREMTFTDIHIVSVDRALKGERETIYETGIRCYIVEDQDGYKLCSHYPSKFVHEGIFYKEVGTDFNNGIFKFMYRGKAYELIIHDNHVADGSHVPIPKKG